MGRIKPLSMLQYPIEKKGNSSTQNKKRKKERYIIFYAREYLITQETEYSELSHVKKLTHIKLYAPNQLSEEITQNWGGEQIFNAKNAKDTISEFGAKVGLGLVSKLGGGGAGALKKKFGVVINPKEELLYTGPGDFRTFSFDFEFAPKSKQEANVVKQIISSFRKYSLPKGSFSSATLSFPPLWELKTGAGYKITDFGWEGRHFALTQVSANFTPEGSYISFEDGFPAKTSISLTFQETHVLYQDDIKI